jgi:murein L,D-transpeptidase YcbB/YkuD
MFLRLVLLVALGSSSLADGARAASAPEGTSASLRTLVESSRHPDLRWPAFPDIRTELERLYQRAAWRPLWLSGTQPTRAAVELIARLSASDSLGLDPADYDAPWLQRTARDLATIGPHPPQDEPARFDLALSVAAVRFVSALHRGRVSSRLAHAELFIPRRSLAAEMVVDSLRDEDQQGPLLERIQPPFHHYQLLKNSLARYRGLARDTSLVPLPTLPPVVRPGMTLHAASRLRHLLEATQDLPRSEPIDVAKDTVYSSDLVAGVKSFQRRQGYETDGTIGPQTAAQLNRPFDQRVRQIELTLERWRWLPPSFTAPPIIVNIPAFQLYAFRDFTDREDSMLAMNVIVGSSYGHDTPVFAADMTYLIFRPYWEVPLSIMKYELGPTAMNDPEFMEREGMVLVSGESEDAPTLPATPENLERIGKDLRVRQLPGPANALGLIKFILPNAQKVFLHDSAAKGLFAYARRDFSHGCIRVSEPVALARHVLRDQPEWTEERIREAMDGADNLRVSLARPVPVYIVYATSVARDNGEVYFYSDLYGLDHLLDELLKEGYPYPN